MTLINFPSSPATNDEYTFGGKTWVYNGTGWKVKPGTFNAPTIITSSIYYYVNSSTGSNANDGLSTSTPFATLEYALHVVERFYSNIDNTTVYIKLADGTYTPTSSTVFSISNLKCTLLIEGNTSDPSLVILTKSIEVNNCSAVYFNYLALYDAISVISNVNLKFINSIGSIFNVIISGMLIAESYSNIIAEYLVLTALFTGISECGLLATKHSYIETKTYCNTEGAIGYSTAFACAKYNSTINLAVYPSNLFGGKAFLASTDSSIIIGSGGGLTAIPGTDPGICELGGKYLSTDNTVKSSNTNVNIVVLTSGTAWTVPYNVDRIKVTIVGGGGGGGLHSSTNYCGYGGQSGGYIVTNFNVTPFDIISYSIGAGGTGATATAANATGSSGGNTVFNGVTAYGGGGGGATFPGTGGSTSGGTLQITGAQGAGLGQNVVNATSGFGGSNPLGRGGVAPIAASVAIGGALTPTGFGAGGAGGSSASGTITAQSGLAGVIIIEY